MWFRQDQPPETEPACLAEAGHFQRRRGRRQVEVAGGHLNGREIKQKVEQLIFYNELYNRNE